MKSTFASWLKIAVHPLSLLPLALLLFDAAMGRLSVNPIQDLTLRTGKPALYLLMLCLACTPANLLLGWKWAVALRKPLGLYGFLYVCLHLLIFVALDYGLNLALILDAVAEKRFVLAGFAAFLLLLPLALTSTKWSMRRLGRWWKRVHWLIYPAGILAVLHYLWLSKVPYEPLIFGAALAALLVVRLPAIRRWLAARRRPAARGARAAAPADAARKGVAQPRPEQSPPQG
jgi:sulfoxide reductase heme-binding subunit YedZ